MQKRVLKGSNRKPVAGEKLIGKADENRRIEVTIVLKAAADLTPRRTLPDPAVVALVLQDPH